MRPTDLPTWSIHPAPAIPAGGHLASALAVSLLVHVTIALVGVDPTAVADLEVDRGKASPPATLTLTLAESSAAQRPSIVVARPPVGLPDARPNDNARPANLPEWTLMEKADVAAVLRQVQQALAEFQPTPPARGREAAEPAPPDAPLIAARPARSDPGENRAAEPAPPATPSAATASNDRPRGAEVDVDARPLPDNPPPSYPPAAVAQGRQGRAMLRVRVDPQGRALDVTVLRSSGHADLDQAAVAAVQRWVFVPARQAGRPVAQTIAVPIRFLHGR